MAMSLEITPKSDENMQSLGGARNETSLERPPGRRTWTVCPAYGPISRLFTGRKRSLTDVFVIAPGASGAACDDGAQPSAVIATPIATAAPAIHWTRLSFSRNIRRPAMAATGDSATPRARTCAAGAKPRARSQQIEASAPHSPAPNDWRHA